MQLRVAVLAVAVAVSALAGNASAAPTLNGIYDVSDTPLKLTQGSDGNVWVVVGGNTLARFAPDGTKQEFPLTGVTNAKGITSGPDGNLWLTAPTELVKVPPANPAGLTTFTVNDIITPNAIVTGPDGNLWTGSADKVLKIKPTDPANPTLFTLTSTTSPAARGITRAGGLLWVVDFGGAIVSLTTAGVQTPYSVGGLPQEVGGSPSGQVLYANPGTVPQTIGRIVPGGMPLTTDRPGVGTDPFGITFGQDGAFWVAEFAAGQLARVTPDGVVTTLGGLPKNDPREITTGQNNTLWVSLEQSKKVARVTGVTPPAVIPVTTTGGGGTTPPTTTPGDRTAPVLSGVRLSPSRFRRGGGQARADLGDAARRGEAVTETQRGGDGDVLRRAPASRPPRRWIVRRAIAQEPGTRGLHPRDGRRRDRDAEAAGPHERRRLLRTTRTGAQPWELPARARGHGRRRQPLRCEARVVHVARARAEALTSGSFEARRDVLVVRRPGEPVAVVGRGQVVRRDARDHVVAVLAGIRQAEAVRQ